MNDKRIRTLNSKPIGNGPIIYWMNRDQRAEDNWALLYAQELALKAKAPLLVVFNLVPNFLGGTARQHEFKLRGLEETAQALQKKSASHFFLSPIKPGIQARSLFMTLLMSTVRALSLRIFSR